MVEILRKSVRTLSSRLIVIRATRVLEKARSKTLSPLSTSNLIGSIQNQKVRRLCDTSMDLVSRDTFLVSVQEPLVCIVNLILHWLVFDVVKNLLLGDNAKICQTRKHSFIDGPSPNRL